MADDLTLKITIPKADDKAFIRALDKMLSKLDQVQKKIKKVDKASESLGSKTGKGAAAGGGAAASASQASAAAARIPATPAVPIVPVIPTGTDKKISKLGTAISTVGSAAGGTAGRVASLTGRIATFAAGAGGAALQVGLLVAALAALVVITFKSVKAFSEFEASLGNVARVANLSDEAVEKFGADVLKLSTELPVSTREIFKFADALANAGLVGEELNVATEEFTKLNSVIKNLDTGKVQDILRFRQLTGSAQAIGEVNDNFLKLSQSVVATTTQIVKSSSQIATAFVGTGAAAEEIQALGAVVAGLRKNTQRTATSLGKVRQAIAALNSVPDEKIQSIIDTLEDPSIDVASFRALAAEVGGVSKVFDLITKKTTDLTGVLDTLGLSASSVGNAQVRAVVAQGELIDKATAAIEKGNAIGTVDEQAEKKLQEFGSQVTILANQFSGLFVRIGAVVADFLKPFVTLLASAIGFINKIFDGFKALSDLIPDVGKNIIGFLIAPWTTAARIGAEVINDLSTSSAKAAEEALEATTKNSALRISGLVSSAEAELDKLKDIRLLDEGSFNTAVKANIILLKNDMAKAGRSAAEIEKAVAAASTTFAKEFAPELAQAAKNSDTIAQNLVNAQKQLAKIASQQEKFDLELNLEESALKGVERTIAKIGQDTKITLGKETFDFSRAEAGIEDALLSITGASSFDPTKIESTIERLENLRKSTGNVARSQSILDLIKLVETFDSKQSAVQAIKDLGQTKINIAISKDFNKAFDEGVKKAQELRDIDLTPLEQQFEKLKKIIGGTFASENIKSQNVLNAQADIAKTLATNFKSTSNEVVALQNKINDFNLSDFSKNINQIARNTQSALNEVTLSPEQRENATDDIIKKEEQSRKKILQLDRLQRLNLINEEFKKRKEIIQADREAILNTQAESVSAVTDAGSAVEAVNQAQRDEELQEELLTVNQQQLRQLKLLAAKAKTRTVVFPPAR